MVNKNIGIPACLRYMLTGSRGGGVEPVKCHVYIYAYF